MVFSLFAPQVTGGSLVIAVSVIGLALALWQNSRVGATTVQLWQSRSEGLEEQLNDSRANLHQAEIQIKDRETQIAALEQRPNTETFTRLVEQHHSENQAILSRLADTQDQAMKILAGLASQQQTWDGTDRRSGK